MKVSITKEMKKVITIADMPAVREVIKTMQYDATTAKEAAEAAASAEIAGNCRIWDYYHFDDCSDHYDVWINFTAVIANGFGGIIMGGAYLSDINSATGDNDEELRDYMFIRKFTEKK